MPGRELRGNANAPEPFQQSTVRTAACGIDLEQPQMVEISHRQVGADRSLFGRQIKAVQFEVTAAPKRPDLPPFAIATVDFKVDRPLETASAIVELSPDYLAGFDEAKALLQILRAYARTYNRRYLDVVVTPTVPSSDRESTSWEVLRAATTMNFSLLNGEVLDATNQLATNAAALLGIQLVHARTLHDELHGKYDSLEYNFAISQIVDFMAVPYETFIEIADKYAGVKSLPKGDALAFLQRQVNVDQFVVKDLEQLLTQVESPLREDLAILYRSRDTSRAPLSLKALFELEVTGWEHVYKPGQLALHWVLATEPNFELTLPLD